MTPSRRNINELDAAAAALSAEELLTPKQTATLLGVSLNTLPMWRWQGKGPPFIKLGDGPFAAIRYRRSELLLWLEARTTGTVHA